jgi:hypothetical protein
MTDGRGAKRAASRNDDLLRVLDAPDPAADIDERGHVGVAL